MPDIQDARIQAPLVYAEAICFLVFCPLMVALRFYARRVSGSSLGLDDGACALALLFVVALAVTLIAITALKDLGYPADVGDPPDQPGHPNANQPSWPFEILQVPALAFIKLTFLLLYRRIFTQRVARKFSWVNWSMIVLVSIWGLAFTFSLLFICGSHFSAYWTSQETEEQYCPTYDIHLSFAISDVITDVFTILLPLPEIWKLHLPTRRKFAIIGVFSLGALTIAMSVIRLVILYKALTVLFDPYIDLEYLTTLVLYISMLEAGFGLIASCLPVQYGLLRSEVVRDILRTVITIASLGSVRSSHSGRSHGSRFSRHTPQQTLAPKHTDSQGSEANITLPGSAAFASHEDIELGRLPSTDGIVVTQSFETQAQPRHAGVDDVK